MFHPCPHDFETVIRRLEVEKWNFKISIRSLTKFFRIFLETFFLQILSTYWSSSHLISYSYNIPRACLLNGSPVPAMDLKSNRSDLWRHMPAELVVGWEDYVANIQTMSRDIIKPQLSQHFCCATEIFSHATIISCRATWVSCRVGVTLYCDFYTFRSCNTCTFSLPTFAVLQHMT